MGLFRALPLVAVCVVQAQTNIVNVDWSTTLHPLKTVAGFQTVVNPLTSRESPIHDAVYASIAALGAEYQVRMSQTPVTARFRTYTSLHS